MSSDVRSSAIAGVVDRPRLYHALDSPAVRVCVVEGLSGSGKTTLLRSWLLRQEHPHPLIWISLNDGITSRLAFWEHVVSSALRLGGLSADEAAQYKRQLWLDADPVRIASEVLVAAGPVVMVLDAYEHLGDAVVEIDADLTRLVVAAPDLRLLVTTRGHTALADLDLPGAGIVRVISLGELALTVDEIAILIERQAGIDDRVVAESVAQVTQGFALTVRAVVLALARLGRIPRVGSMEWNDVVAARWESLLPDAGAVQFVTDTCVAPYVDAALAASLSGYHDAASMLDMLERNGFGRWIPYSRDHQVFQYVETIRDTFRGRARDDQDRYRAACVTTAMWLLEHEEVVDQALQFAIEGHDYALADRVFVSVVIGNPDSYTTDRFLSTLRTVPEQRLAEYPMLAFGLGLAMAANPILRAEGMRCFQIAADSTAQGVYLEPAIDLFSSSGMRAVARRLAGHYRASAAACVPVLDSLERFSPPLLAEYGEHIGTILRQMSYSLLQGDSIDLAAATIGRSVALCPTTTTQNYSLVYAALISAFAGDVVRADKLLDSVDADAWPLEQRRNYLNAPRVIAEGYTRLDAFDFAGVDQVLRSTDCYTRTTEFWPYLTAMSVASRYGLGQARAEAGRVTRELSEIPVPPGIGDSVGTEHLHALLAFAWLAGGEQEAAERAVDGQPDDSPYTAAARIAVRLEADRDREAWRLARELIALPGHTLRTLAETQTFAAAAALRMNERGLAWSWLNAAGLTWTDYGPRLHVALLAARDRRALDGLAEEHRSPGLRNFLELPLTDVRANVPVVEQLTPREVVVLAALAEHPSVREIADALVVSPNTVKSQLRSIYRKLGVASRHSALTVARELGLSTSSRD